MCILLFCPWKHIIHVQYNDTLCTQKFSIKLITDVKWLSLLFYPYTCIESIVQSRYICKCIYMYMYVKERKKELPFPDL